MAANKKDRDINKDQYEKVDEFLVEQRATEAPVESKEILEDKETIDVEHEKLKDQIESMDIDDGLKSQVSSDASSGAMLDEQKKLKYLLALAQKKGVVYAVHIAKNMNDPYLLDTLHDMLAREGYYKEFIK